MKIYYSTRVREFFVIIFSTLASVPRKSRDSTRRLKKPDKSRRSKESPIWMLKSFLKTLNTLLAGSR